MQSCCFLLSREHLAARSLHSLVLLTLRLCRDIRDKLRINKPVKCTPSCRAGKCDLIKNIRLLLQNYFRHITADILLTNDSWLCRWIAIQIVQLIGLVNST